METGFRRLWSRKKSAGASDRSTHQRNISSRSGMTIKSQAITSGRPSMAASQSDRPYSRDRLTDKRDYLTTPSTDDPTRPKTVGRYQPMLVGISRPDTGIDTSRPETAGSFQNAVLRAADAVNPQTGEPPARQQLSQTVSQPAPRPQSPLPSQPTSQPDTKSLPKPPPPPPPPIVTASKPMSIQSQQREKPSRHVDIFSIATSVPSPLSQYNEEIAERNLDTIRLALENTPYVYNPDSKYQEEVATRNAILPYKSRTSTDTLPRVTDTGRTASLTNRSTQNATSPRPRSSQSQNRSYFHSHQPSNASVEQSQAPSRGRPTQQHVRQTSQRSTEAARLSVIPQEDVYESGLPEPSHSRGPSQTMYQGLRVMPSVPAYNEDFQDESSYEIVPAPPATVTGHPVQNSTVPEVQASTSTYGMQSLDASVPMRTVEQKTYQDAAYMPAPRNAALLPKRLEGRHRTFMDLTDEEAEQLSETSSAYPASQYSAYSPIVEQANFDAVQRVLPSQIRTEERRNSRVIEHAPNLVHVDLNATPKAQTPRLQTPMKQTPKRQSPRLAPAVLASSAFSPISTVASWSPRASVATQPQQIQPSAAPTQSLAEPSSMTARVAAILEANRSGTKDNVLPVSQKRGDETPTVRERVASFESHSDRRISPANSLSNISSENGKTRSEPASILFSRAALAPVADTEMFASQPVAPIAKPQTEAPVAQPVSSVPLVPSVPSVPMLSPSQPSFKPAAQVSSPVSVVEAPVARTASRKAAAPSIYTSPESIKSADYINPGNAFGIKTRDFAAVPDAPLKETQSAIEVPTVKQFSKRQTSSSSKKGKSVKARTTQNTPIPSRSKEDTFDEEAFARKRAEAQAALERLKESLNENFMTLPDRATVKSTTIIEEEPETKAVPIVEPKPVVEVPAVAVPPEQRTSMVIPAIQRPESDKPPPSSYRNSRGDTKRTSLASSSRSLSTGSRSSRRAPAPTSLKNVEPAANPIDQKMLSPALLQALSMTSMAPKSPGEISLSSFPVPSSSRPPSQPEPISGYSSHHNSFVAPQPQYSYTATHSHQNSVSSNMKRRNSTKSQMSTISAFSIPFHMVPGRTSSVKDPLPEEESIW